MTVWFIISLDPSAPDVRHAPAFAKSNLSVDQVRAVFDEFEGSHYFLDLLASPTTNQPVRQCHAEVEVVVHGGHPPRGVVNHFGIPEVLRRLLEVFQANSLSPAFGGRALALSQLGRHIEAQADLQRAAEFDKASGSEELRYRRALVFAHAGDHIRATAEADALGKNETVTARTLFDLARIWALAARALHKDAKLAQPERAKLSAQDATRAVEVLRKARAAGYFEERSHIEQLKTAADFDSLRGQEEYQKLLADLEKTGPQAK